MKPHRLLTAALFFCSCLTSAMTASAGEKLDASKATPSDDGKILWYDVQNLDVEGRAFNDTKAFYDRLPASAEKTVRGAVWGLSRHSAGMCARFVTDATVIHARWTLTSSRLAMPHMPATGVSGLDLYVKTAKGRWRWLANGRPTKQTNSVRLAGGIPKGTREYMLYLPLYNGVTSVEIGIAADNKLSQAKPRASGRVKPLLFYGTSITQGGCASRPGMVHTAILGRWLDVPVLNFGFSGNGKLEPELGVLYAKLDPAVYVLDCLPNMNAAEVAKNTEPFVRILRKAHPTTPILFVEDRSYSDAFLIESKRIRNETSRAAFKKAYDKLVASGVKNLHYLKGDGLLGEDNEGTVDTSHPTDLGFLRQAEAFREVLEPLLK